MKSRAPTGSPAFGTSAGLNAKHRFLPEVSNRTQLILKNMFHSEDKHMRCWRNRFDSNQFRRPPDTLGQRYNEMYTGQLPARGLSPDPQAHIQDNLALLTPHRTSTLGTSGNMAVSPAGLMGPVKYVRTQVRNRSFDPIVGYERTFNTPQKKVQTFGTNGGGSFYSLDFHRLGPLYQGGKTIRS